MQDAPRQGLPIRRLRTTTRPDPTERDTLIEALRRLTTPTQALAA